MVREYGEFVEVANKGTLPDIVRTVRGVKEDIAREKLKLLDPPVRTDWNSPPGVDRKAAVLRDIVHAELEDPVWILLAAGKSGLNFNEQFT